MDDRVSPVGPLAGAVVSELLTPFMVYADMLKASGSPAQSKMVWALLEQQLTDIYGDDKKRLLCELCVANIRFRIVNPHFRAVLTMNEQALTATQRQEIGRSLEHIGTLCKEVFERDVAVTQFRLQAIVYGTTMLIGSGAYTDAEQTVSLARQAVESIIASAL